MRFHKLTRLAAALALLAGFGQASASPCTGIPPFTDITQASNYCTDAEWLKNRSVTLGCTSTTLFCPNDVVTRASMALFMQRLGTALSPQVLITDDSGGTIDLDAAAPIIACQTADFATTGYPRRAFISTTFAGAAAGALQYQHEVYYSTNGGANWTFTNNNINRNGTSAAHWVSSNTNYVQDLNVGTNYRWGVRLGREAGTADFGAYRCFINVEVLNRTGTATPFDSAVRSVISDN
jgi:hypothetical protein